MEGKQHGDVVSAIKAGGDEAKLLVVDKETDEFFKKCKVTPSQQHLDGEFTVGCPKPGVWQLPKAWPEMGVVSQLVFLLHKSQGSVDGGSSSGPEVSGGGR